MKNIEHTIRERRSVRTFAEKSLTQSDMDKLLTFMADVDNPYGIPVEFTLLDTNKHTLPCPVVVGAELYVGGKIKKIPHAEEAFGYSFERLVLYAQSLGIGTVWLGGTMDRGAFERAMDLRSDEMMPCAAPLGYPAAKMSLRETMMRKAIKADCRDDFEKLFFDGSFDTPLTREKAGKLALPLEMVRLAPSAVNRQPWRVLLSGDAVHFFLRRAKIGGGSFDMQKIDLGIALCHFALAAEEQGIQVEFFLIEPAVSKPAELEYIASYRLI